VSLFDLSLEQLADHLSGWGEPGYRARQVHDGVWKRGSTYEEMTDLPATLRARLAEEVPLGVEVVEERTADGGSTRKALLWLGGRHLVEVVLMGYRERVTTCVSSQSGCAMGCGFCATGQMGLRNNLTAGEIAAQAWWARREAAALQSSTPRRLSNIVFMGMGEPLANERNTFGALERLTDPRGSASATATSRCRPSVSCPRSRGSRSGSRRSASPSACTLPTTSCGTSSSR
jgi:23S rRNA (adenine2503-C2)-methyltransferase